MIKKFENFENYDPFENMSPVSSEDDILFDVNSIIYNGENNDVLRVTRLEPDVEYAEFKITAVSLRNKEEHTYYLNLSEGGPDYYDGKDGSEIWHVVLDDRAPNNTPKPRRGEHKKTD